MNVRVLHAKMVEPAMIWSTNLNAPALKDITELYVKRVRVRCFRVL